MYGLLLKKTTEDKILHLNLILARVIDYSLLINYILLINYSVCYILKVALTGDIF